MRNHIYSHPSVSVVVGGGWFEDPQEHQNPPVLKFLIKMA